MLESADRGGLKADQIAAQLTEGWIDERGDWNSVQAAYDKWGFGSSPAAGALVDALFGNASIEWNRIREVSFWPIQALHNAASA